MVWFCPPARVGQQKGGTSSRYGSAISAAAVRGEGFTMDVVQEGREGTSYGLIAPSSLCVQQRGRVRKFVRGTAAVKTC